MKPAPLVFRRAESIEHAIGLIVEYDGFGKYLGGGQTLGPLINLRLVQPDLVVDISRLAELRGFELTSSHLIVGGGTLHADFEDGVVSDPANGLLRKVASGIAYRAVRNRGTLGGSLAHADPSAEWPVVMMALAARIRVQGAAGRRIIKADELILGAMTTSLADEEIIEAVEIPRFSASMRWGFKKRCRKLGEFAQALAVVVHDRERRYCRVVVGACGGAPVSLTRSAALLANTVKASAGFERELRAAFVADIDEANLTLDDYDRHVHGLTVIRAAKEALS